MKNSAVKNAKKFPKKFLKFELCEIFSKFQLTKKKIKCWKYSFEQFFPLPFFFLFN